MEFITNFSSPEVEAYVNGGSGDEITLRENLASIANLRIIPRVLRNIETIDTSVKDSISVDRSPIVIAPTAFHQLATDQAEVAPAIAASNTKTPYIVSCYSSIDIQKLIHNVDRSIYWQQLYIFDDRKITEKILDYAECFNAKAIVVTVGAAVSGNRIRERAVGWKSLKNIFILLIMLVT